MSRRFLLIALTSAVAQVAAAQPLGGEHRGPSPGGPPLFISPSGEPFRGGDGLAAWFARADADRDGAITLEEFQADALRFFHTLDANHDGRIDGFETQAYERDVAPEITQLDFDHAPGFDDERGERGRRGQGRVRRGGAGGEGAARYSLINEAEPVANADADLDSRVTLEEWRRATVRRFEVLDKAKAGRLTMGALRPTKKLPAPFISGKNESAKR